MSSEDEAAVRSIAQELKDIYNGDLYYCAACDEMHHKKDIVVDEDGDPYCPVYYKRHETYEWLEQATFADFFRTTYDTEYRVSERDAEHIKSVKVAIATGGPGIYVDTGDCKVKLYWSNDYAEASIFSEVAEKITELYDELWQISKK